MKKQEAMPLIKNWSQFYIESIEKILGNREIQAEIKFYTGKVVGEKELWCAYEILTSQDLGIKPSSGVTRIPSVHSTLFANQILEDIISRFMNDETVDFSYFSHTCGMFGPSFHGFHMGENDPRVSINFENLSPDIEHQNAFNDALTQKEENKNTRKR